MSDAPPLALRLDAVTDRIDRAIHDLSGQIASHEAWRERTDAARDETGCPEDAITQAAFVAVLDDRVQTLRTKRDRAGGDLRVITASRPLLEKDPSVSVPEISRILRHWEDQAPPPRIERATGLDALPEIGRPILTYRDEQPRRRLSFVSIIHVLALLFLGYAGLFLSGIIRIDTDEIAGIFGRSDNRPTLVQMSGRTLGSRTSVSNADGGAALLEDLVSKVTGLPPLTSMVPDALDALR